MIWAVIYIYIYIYIYIHTHTHTHTHTHIYVYRVREREIELMAEMYQTVTIDNLCASDLHILGTGLGCYLRLLLPVKTAQYVTNFSS